MRRHEPQRSCRLQGAYVGYVLSGGVLALGLRPFIWGLFTGNRAVSEAL